ncbi:MAG: bifunctional D-glycero-beta-D-manno-heptose-7-phosphate kinase/D-glycero-beta-D-manno-heptose 1-phosphate adenylyltransferase HldE [Candidatus Berkiellales bacterium]
MLTCPDFTHSKIVVLGDAMLDRYWHGDTSRISPEAPVPIVKIEHEEERVGGAANVAINLQVLGVKTTLVSAIGNDDTGSKLYKMLTEQGVSCNFIQSSDINTILKLRVLGRHQQLIRLDFEDKYHWSADKMLEPLKSVIHQADVLILSDYAKGTLSEPQPIIQYARQQGVKVVVDPKNADLSIYRGAHLLTPNLAEFEAAVGHCEDIAAIEKKGLKLVEDLNLTALLVTMGSRGMLLIEANKPAFHIRAQAREVFDITGAGDTVIAVLGACLAAGSSLSEAAVLANLAAGISVGKLGTATITPDELTAAIAEQHATHQPQSRGVISLPNLLFEIQKRKIAGDKIVMTNGCFDILHAGHVTYLQQARALGDCLIIAVNDDHSVRRLKGVSRPINPLAERMQVLAALGCVDYVVPFSEDTPEALITQVLPNILVKGGDYQVHQIAGAKQVIHHGGKVEILPFVPGCSTTGMLERAKEKEEALV